MKGLLSKISQKFGPIRRTFLHILCFSSFPAVVLGWSLLDRIGPIGVLLPTVGAIWTSLAKIDSFQESKYVRKDRLQHCLKKGSEKAP